MDTSDNVLNPWTESSKAKKKKKMKKSERKNPPGFSLPVLWKLQTD